MRKSRISTGIIGLGKIGLLYDLNTKKTLTYSKALTKNKLFKLDFACDPNKQKLKIFKKTYGTNCFENLKDAFKIYKSDLIIICASTKLHYSIFKNVMSVYSPKAFIFEKPFTDNFKHANEIYKICKKKNIKIFVNYIRSLNPKFHEIKKKYLSDNYKKFNFNFYYPGEFLNNGSHFIDLMIYLRGYPDDYKLLKKKNKFFDVKFSYKNGDAFIKSTYFHKKKASTIYLKIGDKKFRINNDFFKFKEKKINIELNNYQLNLLSLVYKNLKNNTDNKKNNLRSLKVLKLINKMSKNEI